MAHEPTVSIQPRIDSTQNDTITYYGFVYVTHDGSSGPDTRLVFHNEGGELEVHRAQSWPNPSRRQITAVLDALRPEAAARGLTI